MTDEDIVSLARIASASNNYSGGRWISAEFSRDDLVGFARAVLSAALDQSPLSPSVGEKEGDASYLCIAPACGKDCDQCREAISPQQVRDYAIRYAMLRNVPDDKLNTAGVPCIAIPESPTSGNFANKEDADAAIDAALSASQEGAEE